MASFYNDQTRVQLHSFHYLFKSMKSFKKTVRLLGFIILMVLASAGVGLMGGIPMPTVKRREQTIEIKVELTESNEEEESETTNVYQKK